MVGYCVTTGQGMHAEYLQAHCTHGSICFIMAVCFIISFHNATIPESSQASQFMLAMGIFKGIISFGEKVWFVHAFSWAFIVLIKHEDLFWSCWALGDEMIIYNSHQVGFFLTMRHTEWLKSFDIWLRTCSWVCWKKIHPY